MSDATLLVVDGNEDNRYTLVMLLRREGYSNIVEVASGQAALDYLETDAVDLVLLDVMMPEMTGYDVLERMQANERLRDIPVIMISALDELSSVVRCIEAGAEDYLPRPFNAVLLKARLRASLEKKRLRDDTRRQLEVIRNIFGKYVPQSVVEAIVEGQGSIKPQLATATIMYTDIEAFTTTVQSLRPEQVVEMLNAYFPTVIEPITLRGGIVNQFQGDAMLVTFNVPVQDPRHAECAIDAAREIQAILKERKFAGTTLKTRIGINTGQVIAGNVGSGERINYTVHGDAVNVAARLEQLNKEHGSNVLVSESTVSLLDDPQGLTSIGEVHLRGMTGSITVYRLD